MSPIRGQNYGPAKRKAQTYDTSVRSKAALQMTAGRASWRPPMPLRYFAPRPRPAACLLPLACASPRSCCISPPRVCLPLPQAWCIWPDIIFTFRAKSGASTTYSPSRIRYSWSFFYILHITLRSSPVSHWSRHVVQIKSAMYKYRNPSTSDDGRFTFADVFDCFTACPPQGCSVRLVSLSDHGSHSP